MFPATAGLSINWCLYIKRHVCESVRDAGKWDVDRLLSVWHECV